MIICMVGQNSFERSDSPTNAVWKVHFQKGGWGVERGGGKKRQDQPNGPRIGFNHCYVLSWSVCMIWRNALQLQSSAVLLILCRLGASKEKGRMKQGDKSSQAEHSSDLLPGEMGGTGFGDLMCQRIMYFAGRDINKTQMQSHQLQSGCKHFSYW